MCGFSFSVYVGIADGEPRAFALSRHEQLSTPDTSVLVFVDPSSRALEIVTGAEVHHTLPDSSVGLVALSMQSSFAAGDLVNGITHGVNQLAEYARRPASLHTDSP